MFALLVNQAEHCGHIVEFDPETEDPREYCLQYETYWGEYKHEKDADTAYDEYIQCDSVENNTYCYTHNPNPQAEKDGE